MKHSIIEMNGKKTSKTLTQKQIGAVMSAWASCNIFEDAHGFRYLFNDGGKLVARDSLDGSEGSVGQVRVFSDEAVNRALDQKAHQDKVMAAHTIKAAEMARQGLYIYFGEWLTPEQIEAKRDEYMTKKSSEG